MKKKILQLFYDNGLSQKEISKRLDVSKGYVSRIVTNDSRYTNIKKKKLEMSKQKHNKQIQRAVEDKRKALQFKYAVDDLVLKKLHEQATLELSARKHLTNEGYRKWNISAYKYNSNKKRYEFDETLGRSYDVPKFIKIVLYWLFKNIN